jgi:hypothetical protein
MKNLETKPKHCVDGTQSSSGHGGESRTKPKKILVYLTKRETDNNFLNVN